MLRFNQSSLFVEFSSGVSEAEGGLSLNEVRVKMNAVVTMSPLKTNLYLGILNGYQSQSPIAARARNHCSR